MEPVTKSRLDQLLVDRHGYETRSRARDAVLRSCVMVDGKPALKPGQTVSSNSIVTIDDKAARYVSRAALKLLAALETSGIDVRGKIALDLGASTGGFSQVLLERGASRVYAIDVGSGQLHPSLADNHSLISIENLNVRDLALGHLENTRPEILVSDLSFISLKLALPPALALAAKGAKGLFLIKPQFEVGKKGLGSGGIVRDQDLIETVIKDLGDWLNQQPGWTLDALSASPITGGDGNHEFLMIGHKDMNDE